MFYSIGVCTAALSIFTLERVEGQPVYRPGPLMNAFYSPFCRLLGSFFFFHTRASLILPSPARSCEV